MVLASFVLVLVSHAFIVQNEFYALQTVRVGVQDNARAGTELLAREIRDAAEDGVVVAGPRTLTVRSPMAIAGVCYRQGTPNADVLTEGGQAALRTSAVAGVALRNDSTWEYLPTDWASIDGSDVGSADNCHSNGADTVGARDDFHRLTGVAGIFSGGVDAGDVIMIYRETTFTIEPSQLDPGTLGLFRAEYGSSPVEFATGVDSTARFRYRTGPGTYVDTVTAASLPSVDAVRIELDTRRAAVTGGADDVTFGWAVTVPLRNVRADGP